MTIFEARAPWRADSGAEWTGRPVAQIGIRLYFDSAACPHHSLDKRHHHLMDGWLRRAPEGIEFLHELPAGGLLRVWPWATDITAVIIRMQALPSG